MNRSKFLCLYRSDTIPERPDIHGIGKYPYTGHNHHFDPQRFDSTNAPDIEKELRSLLASHPEKVILDFSGTDYIASAGLRILLVITRDQIKSGGRIALAAIRPSVLKVFQMAGFTSIFTICSTRDEALRTLG